MNRTLAPDSHEIDRFLPDSMDRNKQNMGVGGLRFDNGTKDD